MDSEKIHLPKLRKILHTNLVDIGYFADMTNLANLRSSQKPKDSLARMKNAQQSPKISQTAKEILLRTLKKSQNNSKNISKDLDTIRSTDSNNINLRFYKHFEIQHNERLLTSSPTIKRGLSGYSVSKLHKSRFEIKNRLRNF